MEGIMVAPGLTFEKQEKICGGCTAAEETRECASTLL